MKTGIHYKRPWWNNYKKKSDSGDWWDRENELLGKFISHRKICRWYFIRKKKLIYIKFINIYGADTSSRHQSHVKSFWIILKLEFNYDNIKTTIWSIMMYLLSLPVWDRALVAGRRPMLQKQNVFKIANSLF